MLSTLREKYLAAQLNGDRKEALRLLEEEGVQRGADVLDLQLDVVQEAQREIGQLWQQNRISIAEEHMATAISQLALAHLYQHAKAQPSNGKDVLVACVEGELHDFPARLAADALDLAGFNVRYLGASVPHDHLVRMVQQRHPHLLALSVTMSFNTESLMVAVRKVRALDDPPFIAVGGHACMWSETLARDVKADATAKDARGFVEVARSLLGLA